MNVLNTEIWKKIDIKINSSIKYDNPYKDVEIIGIFKNNETEIKLKAFWNGNNEWILRFAPTKVGKWKYNIICFDDNNELSNISGIIEAKENKMTDEEIEAIGAGDQGMMFGYATDETPEYMPYPISLAHKLTTQLTKVRKDDKLS